MFKLQLLGVLHCYCPCGGSSHSFRPHLNLKEKVFEGEGPCSLYQTRGTGPRVLLVVLYIGSNDIREV